jgi:PAS domain S-box-containing protein
VQSVEAAEVEAPASDRSVAEAKLASSPVRDDWYFGVRSQDSNANEKRVPESVWQPIRFIWRTDAEGRLTTISEEFCRTVGLSADSLLGRTFMEITAHLGIDPDGEIANLLKRRDTWSGRTVLWPLADGTQCIPVDLAALPAYSRERRFEGFRGFGVARPGEARAWEGTSFTLSSAREVKDAAEDMAPSVPSDERKEKPATAEKVIRLHDHRQPVAERGLSPVERIAFREIGERLREDAERFKDGTASENRQGANSPEAVTAPMAPFPPEGSSAALDEPTGTGAGEASHPAETAGPDADQFQKTAKAPFTTQTETRQDRDETLPAEVQPADGLLEEEVPRVEEGLSEAAVIPSAFAVAAPAADGAEPAILQRLPVPLIIFGADRLHFANRAFLSLTGYSDLETLEKAGGLAALFADLPAEDGTQAERIIAIRDSDGRTIPAQAQLQSVPWQDGKALLIVLRSADQDVESSARVDRAAERAEAALEDMLARVAEMQTIVDTATDGIVLIAQDGTIRSISRPAEALFGFDSATVTGRPFASLFAVESQRAARDYLNSLAEGGVASVLNDGREVIGREAHGRFIPLFMTIGKLPGDAGYCAVLRDITPWKRAEEELTKARAEAERASSQKTEFLARISHEIRTPLNAIIGFSELMLDEKFGPIGNERYRDYLRDINRSGNHVLDLVNDLLDISKIEAGAQELSYEAVALNEALAEAVALMQPQANRERVIIRSSFATDLPEVVADLRSIRQIALNLLSNAVRYTQAGGQVIVSTAYEPNGDVVLRVRDTGIGMTRAEIEEAMKPFKQLNTLKRSRGDGTGLGLPLTKALAEANRANFAMHSTPGEGTLVEITFPSTRVLAK